MPKKKYAPTPLDFTKTDLQDRQKSLRRLREFLKAQKAHQTELLGAGFFAKANHIPGEDFVVKTPNVSNAEINRLKRVVPSTSKRPYLMLAPSELGSVKDFWEDALQKAQTDRVLGKELAAPSTAIRTSKGAYIVQDKMPQTVGHFVDEYNDAPHVKKMFETVTDSEKKARDLYKSSVKLNRQLDNSRFEIDQLMKNPHAKLDDIIEKNKKLIKAEKKLTDLQHEIERYDSKALKIRKRVAVGTPASVKAKVLKSKIKELGIDPIDFHDSNIGYDPKRKVAKAIDTGLFAPVTKSAEEAYDKVRDYKVILKEPRKAMKALGKKAGKYLPSLIGTTVGLGMMAAAPDADAKDEVFGEMLGSEGLTGPDEREFEREALERSKYNRLKRLLNKDNN